MSLNNIQRQAQQIGHKVLDLLFPPHCAGCQRSGFVLCPTCMVQLPHARRSLCQICGRTISTGTVCSHCRSVQPVLTALQAVGVYEDPLRKCIHALKYEGNTRLAEPLGNLLAEAYWQYGMQADMLIGVPLHSERQKQRGYNHASLLAEVCSRRTGLSLETDILIRQRATAAQVGLSARERQNNVAGAFRCTSAVATGLLYQRTIIIIDDVYTTGATLAACASPLFAAGARAVYGLVLASSR